LQIVAEEQARTILTDVRGGRQWAPAWDYAACEGEAPLPVGAEGGGGGGGEVEVRSGGGEPVEEGGEEKGRATKQISCAIEGRLRERLSAWKAWGASPSVLRWVEHGFDLPWLDQPPPAFTTGRNGEGCRTHAAWLRGAILEWIEVGAARRATTKPTCVCPIDVIEKNGLDSQGRQKFRIIHDLRFVNDFLLETKFKMQTLSRCTPLLKEGWYMCAADLESGYNHLSIAEGDRKYLGFEFEGEYFEMCTLPFGVSVAPEAFTRLTKMMVRRWRQQGWIVVHYLDDFLFLSESKEGAEAMMRQALMDMAELGFGCNKSKCQLEGTQVLQFLGLIVDLRSAPRFWVPEKRKMKLVGKLEEALASPTPTFAEMASIVGSIISMSPVLGRGAMRYTKGMLQMIKPVYELSRRGWKLPSEGWSEWGHEEAVFWRGFIGSVTSCLAAKPKPPPWTFVANTDAGESGMGGLIVQGGAKAAVAKALPQWLVGTSSTLREVFGSFDCVRTWIETGTFKRGDCVLVMTDNTGSRAVHDKGSSSKAAQHLIMLATHELAQSAGVRVFFRWTSREEQNAVAADSLSKADLGDHTIDAAAVGRLERRWGLRFTLDVFAAESNAKAKHFCSKFTESGSLGNALDVDWAAAAQGGWALVHPPTDMIGAAFSQTLTCKVKAVLIVPEWPGAWWFHGLVGDPRVAEVTVVEPRSFGPGSGASASGIGRGTTSFRMLAVLLRADLPVGTPSPPPPHAPPHRVPPQAADGSRR